MAHSGCASQPSVDPRALAPWSGWSQLPSLLPYGPRWP